MMMDGDDDDSSDTDTDIDINTTTDTYADASRPEQTTNDITDGGAGDIGVDTYG